MKITIGKNGCHQVVLHAPIPCPDDDDDDDDDDVN